MDPSKYDKQFRETLDFLKRSGSRGYGEMAKTETTAYPCNHRPCCGNCCFSSQDQKNFEKMAVSIILDLEITLDSLKRAMLARADWSDMAGRLNHFCCSPRYQVILRRAQLVGGEETYLVSIAWKDLLTCCSKYRILKRGYDKEVMYTRSGGNRVIGSLKSKKAAAGGISNCAQSCHGFRFLSGVEPDRVSRKSTYDEGGAYEYITRRPGSAASEASSGGPDRHNFVRQGTPAVLEATQPLRLPTRPRSRVEFAIPRPGSSRGPPMANYDENSRYNELLRSVQAEVAQGRQYNNVSRATTFAGTDYNGPAPPIPAFMNRPYNLPLV